MPVSGLMTGARYLLRGLRLIRLPGVRRFVLVPFLVNTLLFAGLIWVGAREFEGLLEGLLPGWLDWLRWLLWPLFAIALLMVVFYAFTLVANLISSPFNGLLAEAVERQLTGRRPEGANNWKKLLADVLPALFSELRKLLYFVTRSLPALLLFVIPGVNVIAPFVWLAVSAWMLALEYADYPMGNHGLPFSEQRDRLREKRLMALGFGGATLAMTMIPVLNFVAVPTAVAGATAMWVEQWGPHPPAGRATTRSQAV